MNRLPLFLGLVFWWPAGALAAETDKDGIVQHTLASKFQGKPTLIRVLLPDQLEKGKRYRVIYVLPVEAGSESRFGDGLLEVKKLDLHNKLSVVFVAPTFSQLPWYADHPADAGKQQESYLLKDVLPFIEKNYPVSAERKGRLLLGFSKSGCGAFTLLLRHPDVFERAAAWDAPVALDKPAYGGADIFGTQENYENYRIDKLLASKGKQLGKEKRLALTGYNNFRKHHQTIHALLDKLEIPHEYRDEKKDRHHWNAGWIEDSARFLVGE
ncbi:MAG: alpha/beta hydrolase-fold protein [Gemmataceae bacterium]